jgi:AcrR family transcriptional regulator
LNIESTELTCKRAQKSLQTKLKIVDAAMTLLGQHGYEHLTVRNICKLSRVSNGTFYHLYKSKDDLMVEYLKCARNYKECSMNGNDLIGYILALNLSLAECYIEMGVEFASNFHNPKNQVFNPYTRPAKGYALDYYLDKLIEAQKQGLVTGLPIH